jgi:hypothetical protein
MRNSIIAVLAVVLLAHASGGSVQTAHAQQVAVERTPLCRIELHERVGAVIDRDEAQTYRLFTTQRNLHSVWMFRDLDSVAWACIARVGTLPDTLVRLSDPLLVSMAQKIDQWEALQRGAAFSPNLPPAMQMVSPISDDDRDRIHHARMGAARPRLEPTDAVEPASPAPVTSLPAKAASVDTVRPRTMRTVSHAVDHDVLPFAWSVSAPDIPRRAMFGIGGGIGRHAFPRGGSGNARLAELQTGLVYDGFSEGSLSVRVFLPWGITLGAESAERVNDVFVRYELRVIGTARLFAGLGYGRTAHGYESSSHVTSFTAKGTLLHAGLFIEIGMLAIEASVSYCDADEVKDRYSDYDPNGTYAAPVDVWFDPTRSSFRLLLFILI